MTRRPGEPGRPRPRAPQQEEDDRGDRTVLSGPDAAGYQLLDAGEGERLERWGPYRLRRPDARAATLTRHLPESAWEAVDARYEGAAGRGAWKTCRRGLPERWTLVHEGVTLVVKLAPFKHTGVFPEQAAHWRWMRDVAARAPRPLRVLNLFAYTGGATIALAKAGHIVTHVDASKPALAWARENARANDLPSDAIRWIHDDAATFVARERRRGREYDAVLLDPPAFGHAPKGAPTRGAVSVATPAGPKTHSRPAAARSETARDGAGLGSGGRRWRLEAHLPDLVDAVLSLLPDPVFVLINDYARDADARPLVHLLQETMTAAHARRATHSPAPRTDVEAGHLSLQTPDGRRLDTGVFARWSRTAREHHDERRGNGPVSD